ncbi:MAG: PAS domain S-box protein [Chloroflexi bacterium]|uniref:histidine kinase n=1 Tax=Candidatus Chlorohelix allophototropha TaxID=3003348 RepID=A0A8T7LYD7_9CHLR|nr:PAS domain S-box protein [Chloroflexota bacterium]WJW66330.1 PAS domain S-box protein [Chloroflexota bacterium L227-S17]
MNDLNVEFDQHDSELLASENRFRNIINKLLSAVLVIDHEGFVRFANPQAEKLFGRPLSDIVSLPFGFPVFSGDTTEIDILKRDGARTIAELNIIETSWEGSPAYLAVMTDITQRKAAEEKIRFQASLLDNVRNAVLATDNQYKIIYWNKFAEEFYELSGNSLQANDLFALLYPGDNISQQLKDEIRLKVENSGSWEGELARRRKDGVIIPTFTIISTVKDSNVFLGALSISLDLSERKLAEELASRLAAFPRYNPNPVIEFTSNAELSYFNEAAERLTGELHKNHPSEILPSKWQNIVFNCLKTDESITAPEYVIDGKTFTWSFFPIVEKQLVHAYAFDITERLNLENQLRQAQKMESVGQLAGGVAHDFNNILTAIQGYTDLTVNTQSLNSDGIEYLNQVSLASNRAANLTQQLLAFSRRQVMKSSLLDINDVIEQMSKMLRRVIGEDITLRVNYYPNLQSVRGDEGMLQQVLLNLAVNARDAMPKGGQLIITTSVVDIDPLYVTYNLEAQLGKHVCLSVSDTGSGISAEVLPHIFEPFYTTKALGKGTGLGLSTVYGIIKQHKGWITVYSTLEQGTTFNIYVPIDSELLTNEQQKEYNSLVKGGSETILLVEDEVIVLSMVKSILIKLGYKILEAQNATSAMKLWEEHKKEIDLILTDIIMPGGISGIDLVEKIREKDNDVNVIFTSGYSIEMVNNTTNFDNKTQFLPKPYTFKSLAKILRVALDN